MPQTVTVTLKGHNPLQYTVLWNWFVGYSGQWGCWRSPPAHRAGLQEAPERRGTVVPV